MIIDEASQASITLALLAMVKGKKWVIVGDHKQLLPIFKTVKSLEERIALSAFTSLKNKYEHRHLWLQIHYRSHPKIIGFSAKYVYENKIKPAKVCSTRVLRLNCEPRLKFLIPQKPVVFVHVKGKSKKVNKSKQNVKEVEVIYEIVKELINCGVSASSIGVITPYRVQRKIILNKLSEIKSEKRIEVDTVDAFQGREKNVIIYSITDTDMSDFSTDPHRLNVAFTRARSKLIVVGNADDVRNKAGGTLLYDFLKYCYREESVYDWEQKTWLSGWLLI